MVVIITTTADMDAERSRRTLNDILDAKDVIAHVSSGGLSLREDHLEDLELCCFLPEMEFEANRYGRTDYDISEQSVKNDMVRIFAAAGVWIEVDDDIALTIDDVRYVLRTRPTYVACEPESDSDGDGYCRTNDVVYVDIAPTPSARRNSDVVEEGGPRPTS